ncbi:MAG: 3'(2'),5'-bisphosphate nucleotidase CysQ [Saprospiraceae bacterium]|nr:3'(2'),5'-bisphosphate nucleotidase CysQ [Saprospiraceae bacterium]
MPYAGLIQEVKAIAQRAGEAIMEVYNNEADWQVTLKSDDSPLTQADLRANTIIQQGLSALSPEWPIISEENAWADYATRSAYTHWWLVDPLDGTKEFIKRHGDFTVNIALIEGRQPVLSVMYAPAIDQLYWAVRGQGSFTLTGGIEQRLEVAEFDARQSGLRIVCSRSHLNAATQAYINQFDAPQSVAVGSALKLSILAKGEAHIYPRLGPIHEWDIAAGHLILEEAGGSLFQADTGAPLHYNTELLKLPPFIAVGRANGTVPLNTFL